MGGGGEPSGGAWIMYGSVGDLPMNGVPNSRTDLLNTNGEKLQSRWYGANGRPTLDRDYRHGGGRHEFPHDHVWSGDIRL